MTAYNMPWYTCTCTVMCWPGNCVKNRNAKGRFYLKTDKNVNGKHSRFHVKMNGNSMKQTKAIGIIIKDHFDLTTKTKRPANTERFVMIESGMGYFRPPCNESFNACSSSILPSAASCACDGHVSGSNILKRLPCASRISRIASAFAAASCAKD